MVDDWRRLPGHLIPEHLDDGRNGAAGKNMRVFVHGTGMFAEGIVSQDLELLLKVGSANAGVVAPRVPVLLSKYQTNLAATRSSWVEDEN